MSHCGMSFNLLGFFLFFLFFTWGLFSLVDLDVHLSPQFGMCSAIISLIILSPPFYLPFPRIPIIQTLFIFIVSFNSCSLSPVFFIQFSFCKQGNFDCPVFQVLIHFVHIVESIFEMTSSV